MPTRRLPQNNKARFEALDAGKSRKDMVPAPPVIPYTANTDTRIDTLHPVYKAKMDAVDAALIAQGASTALVKTTRRAAELFISHFYTALQNAIARGTFTANIRPGYGLDLNDNTIPAIRSEADINFWGGKINTGETARVAGGGAPITFPSLAEVNTAVNNFKTANLQQANAKDAYDAAQEAIEAENPEADKLILKMWNETETTFDEGNKPSMRRKCRDWGVIYMPIPGETISPDDFSIVGKVTDTLGNEVEDADIEVQETGTTTSTNSNGDYLIPVLDPGTYTLLVHKAGYEDKVINNVVVTAGAITTLDIVMASLSTLGTLTGTVTQGAGAGNATVSIDGTSFTANTGAGGVYEITAIPPGTYTVRCALVSNPANFITNNVTISAGATATVNFAFP